MAVPPLYLIPGVVLCVAVGSGGGLPVSLTINGSLHILNKDPEKQFCVNKDPRAKTYNVCSDTYSYSMPLCSRAVYTRSRYLACTRMSTSMSMPTCFSLSGLQKSSCRRRQSHRQKSQIEKLCFLVLRTHFMFMSEGAQ